jgi:hypothetical protein
MKIRAATNAWQYRWHQHQPIHAVVFALASGLYVAGMIAGCLLPCPTREHGLQVLIMCFVVVHRRRSRALIAALLVGSGRYLWQGVAAVGYGMLVLHADGGGAALAKPEGLFKA